MKKNVKRSLSYDRRSVSLVVGVGCVVLLLAFVVTRLFNRPLLIDQPQSMRTAQISPTPASGLYGYPPNTTVYRDVEWAYRIPDQVYYLDLSNQNLTQIPPEVLELKNLTVLYLNDNNLTSLPPEIAQLTNLTLIDLTGNPITDEEVEKIRRLLPWANIGAIRPMDLPP